MAALEGVVQVVAACGSRAAAGVVVELAAGVAVDLEVEADPVAEVLVAPAGPGELEVGVVAHPAADPERAREGRETEAKRIRQGNG